MFLLNTFAIVILFILSLLLPITSFLLPVYKIKKMKNMTFKSKLIVNILAMVIIGIIDPILLGVYLMFFILIEALYHYFNYLRPNTKQFDRIIITSLAVTVLMGVFLYTLVTHIDINFDAVFTEFYSKYLDFDSIETRQFITYIKNNSLYYLFDYAMISVFFMYISVDVDNYKKWDVSFEWLLLYIVPFFLIHIFKLENFYTHNLLQIGQVIFIFFGVKTVYSFLTKFVKFRFLNNFVSFGLALSFPFASFIIGVLGGFFLKKPQKNIK